MAPAGMGVATLAAAGAGFVNALAGGGTLISFPALTALGLPAVVANVTSSVWTAAIFMAAGALAGRALGGWLAGSVNPRILRRTVVCVGLAVGAAYLVR